jgi:hypothetical protein
LNADGSGTYVFINDFSKMISLAKQMGKSKDTEEIAMDSTIKLASLKDSIKELTPQEKDLLKDAVMHLVMNSKSEKFVMQFTYPFKKADDIGLLNKLSGKVAKHVMGKQMGGEMPQGDMRGGEPGSKSLDDCFMETYANGVITKSLDKAKYAALLDDQSMTSFKEMSLMEPPTFNYIINLPRPVKKTVGKSLKISDDKKKITLNLNANDFFDDPSKFEYRIEY